MINKEQLKFSVLYDMVSPLVQIYELLKWEIEPYNSITPHIIKQITVRKYANKYKLLTFVETGTYLGVMVNAIKNIFNKIYTIELDKKLFKRAKDKFKKYKNIEVILGDSSKVLSSVLKKIKTPSLFWLDAHYSGGITAKGKKESPILEELNQIMKNKFNHVILIDDLNSFTGKNGMPSTLDIKNCLMKAKIKYVMGNENNILIITPKDI